MCFTFRPPPAALFDRRLHQIDAIYFYCEYDIKTARRHALQAWAKKTHQVELEIINGQAISELLSAQNLFWIAQEFLSIPAEYFPPSPTDCDWYKDLKNKWISSANQPCRPADFFEIKQGLRAATHDEDYKKDLPSWMRLKGAPIGPAIGVSPSLGVLHLNIRITALV
jgi:hypothetical protein